MPWIDKCVRSLLNSQQRVDIIVIDNGSTDGTNSYVKQMYPAVHLIIASSNLGFGQANNIGFTYAIQHQADYVFLLNQDAWIDGDCIARLVQIHAIHGEYGILSPVHLNGSGSGFDRFFLDHLVKFSKKDSFSPVHPGPDSDKVMDTEFVNAAAWLISIDCLRKTGGFDPIFFHYGEDDNYAQRVLFWGYKIGVYPKAFIFHDREDRISAPIVDKRVTRQKDLIYFLNQACDIRKPRYLAFVARRIFRYFLQMNLSLLLLKKDAVFNNYFMVTNIVRKLKKIKEARRRCLTGQGMISKAAT